VNAAVLPAALAILCISIGAWVGLDPVLRAIHHNWTSVYGEFAHGYLILALAIWLGVSRLRRSGHLQPRPYWPALGALSLLVGSIYVMDLLYINSPRQSVMPLVLLAAIALVWGLCVARALLWSSLLLYFALPQWWFVNAPLQALTTRVANGLVHLTAIPAYVEGSAFQLPAGTVQIASGCSGMNYLVVALALASFHSMMYLTRWRNRLALCAVAGAMALVINWTRVYLLIVVGYLSDMQHYLIRVDHLYFGWALFMLMMYPVLRYALHLEAVEQAAPSMAAIHAPAPAPAPAAAQSGIVPTLGAAALAACVLSLPGWIGGSSQASPQALAAEPPSLIPPDVQETSVDLSWQPVLVGAAFEQRSAFRTTTAGQVDAYRAVYPWQDLDHRAVRNENDVLGAGWRSISRRPRAIELGTGVTLHLQDDEGTRDGRSYRVWSGYIVAARPVATAWGAKLAEIGGRLAGRRDAVVIAFSARCQADCRQAEVDLEAAVRRFGPSLAWSPRP
jgi:exosortase